MSTMTIHTKTPYEVHIRSKADVGLRLCQDAAALITKTCGTDRRFVLVTDTHVNARYGDAMMDALHETGADGFRLVFPAGEATKSLANLEKGLEFLAAEGVSRQDVIIAMGGGVIGDLAGLMAATFKRGMAYVQVPTTLLSAVDASVGGKTAVNLRAGKNLVGAFWQPSLVVIEEGFFDTLPEHQLLDGLAEIIKCGIVGDATLFEKVRAMAETIPQKGKAGAILTSGDLTGLIESALSVKARLVEADETDEDARRLLNFGHTLAHAVEKASRNEVTHGHAVAWGMEKVTRAASALSWCDPAVAVAVKDVLEKWGFPLALDLTPMEIVPFALRDKKRQQDALALVVPSAIGHCHIQKIALPEVSKFINLAMDDTAIKEA